MVGIPRGDTRARKGTWYPGATFVCPSCGTVISLSSHTIYSTGAVKESVVCPKGDFEDKIALEGWNGGLHEGK